MADVGTDSPIKIYDKSGNDMMIAPHLLDGAVTKGWSKTMPAASTPAVNPMKELKEVPKPMAPGKVAAQVAVTSKQPLTVYDRYGESMQIKPDSHMLESAKAKGWSLVKPTTPDVHPTDAAKQWESDKTGLRGLEAMSGTSLEPISSPLTVATQALSEGKYQTLREALTAAARARKKATPQTSTDPALRDSRLGAEVDEAEAFANSMVNAGVAIGGVAESLTSPENIIILGGMIAIAPFKLAQMLVTAGFSKQMAESAVESFKGMYEAYDNGDPDEAERRAMSGGLDAWMAISGLKHSTHTAVGAAKTGAHAAVDRIGTGVRIAGQEFAGAGKEPIAEAVRERGFKARGAEEQFGKDKAATETKDAQRLTEHNQHIEYLKSQHDAKVADIQTKYADDVTVRNQKVEEQTRDYEQKLTEVRDKWVRGAHETRTAEQTKAVETGHRKTLERAQVSYARHAIKNLQETYAKTKRELGARWNAQRDFVQDYGKVNVTPVAAAIDKARAELAGTPESLRIIDQIEKQVIEENTAQNTGVQTTGSESGGSLSAKPVAQSAKVPKTAVDFQSARTNANAVLDAAYASKDAATFRVLMQIYEAYNEPIRNAVREAGVQRSLRVRDPLGAAAPTQADIVAGDQAVKQYDTLKHDWSQFKEDWDDKKSVSEGGSPLVKARKAVDAHVLLRQIVSDADGRLAATLAKYRQQGANPQLVAKLADLSEQVKGIAKTRGEVEVPSASAGLRATEPTPTSTEKGRGGPNLRAQLEQSGVKPFTPPDAPKPVPEIPAPEIPEFKPPYSLQEPPKPMALTPPEPPPPVNAFAKRLKILEEFSGRPFIFSDWMPQRGIDKILLKNKKFREWVASQPRSDDPDFIPRPQRPPISPRVATAVFKQAVDEIKRLDDNGRSATKDYVRGLITEQGFRQRIESLFPGVDRAGIEDIVQHVNRIKTGAGAGAGAGATPITGSEPTPPPPSTPPEPSPGSGGGSPASSNPTTSDTRGTEVAAPGSVDNPVVASPFGSQVVHPAADHPAEVHVSALMQAHIASVHGDKVKWEARNIPANTAMRLAARLAQSADAPGAMMGAETRQAMLEVSRNLIDAAQANGDAGVPIYAHGPDGTMSAADLTRLRVHESQVHGGQRAMGRGLVQDWHTDAVVEQLVANPVEQQFHDYLVDKGYGADNKTKLTLETEAHIMSGDLDGLSEDEATQLIRDHVAALKQHHGGNIFDNPARFSERYTEMLQGGKGGGTVNADSTANTTGHRQARETVRETGGNLPATGEQVAPGNQEIAEGNTEGRGDRGVGSDAENLASLPPTGSQLGLSYNKPEVDKPGRKEYDRDINAGHNTSRDPRESQRDLHPAAPVATDSSGKSRDGGLPEDSPWSYTRAVHGDVGSARVLGARVHESWSLNTDQKSVLEGQGKASPDIYELDYNDPKVAGIFHGAVSKTREGNKYAASVHVYTPEEYGKMRMFLSSDGKAGFALKPDGDIVSLFTHGDGPKGASHTMLEIAKQAGGTKLDAFDTVLPDIYASHGFRVSSRITWSDNYAPKGWDKGTFAKFNHGEPDVVFMEWDSVAKRAQSRVGDTESLASLPLPGTQLAAVSPNVHDLDTVSKAETRLKSATHKYAQKVSDLIRDGLRTASERREGIGSWTDTSSTGAENTMVLTSHDHDANSYHAILMGKLLKQKSVMVVKLGEGDGAAYSFTVPKDAATDRATVASTLTANGIPYRTILDDPKGYEVVVCDSKGAMDNAVSHAAQAFGLGDEHVQRESADVKFVEGDTRDAAQRVYDTELAQLESTHPDYAQVRKMVEGHLYVRALERSLAVEKPFINAIHFTDKAGLQELDPAHWNTAEYNKGVRRPDTVRQQAFPKLFEPEVYLGEPTSEFMERAGSRITGRSEVYAARLNADNVYDIHTDPDGLVQEAIKRAEAKGDYGREAYDSYVRQVLKENGYEGIRESSGALMDREKVTVQQLSPEQRAELETAIKEGRGGQVVDKILDQNRIVKSAADEDLLSTGDPYSWKMINRYLTKDERAQLDTPERKQRFVDAFNSMPSRDEWAAAIRAGGVNRLWYERSSAAFDALIDSQRKFFKKNDRERFLNFVAALSPQQPVAANLESAVRMWIKWSKAGRPTDVVWDEQGRPNQNASLYRILKGGKITAQDIKNRAKAAEAQHLATPEAPLFGQSGRVSRASVGESTVGTGMRSRTLNAIRALQGEPLSGPKVSSFAPNLGTDASRVTNDTWISVFSGKDPGAISSPAVYNALTAHTREAAKMEGVEPRQAQAAIWSFIKSLAEIAGWGGELWRPPTELVRYGLLSDDLIASHAQDFADLLANDKDIRTKIERLGVDLNALDDKFQEYVPKRPESRPTTEADRKLLGPAAERLDTARYDRRTRDAINRKSGLFDSGEDGDASFETEELESLGPGQTRESQQIRRNERRPPILPPKFANTRLSPDQAARLRQWYADNGRDAAAALPPGSDPVTAYHHMMNNPVTRELGELRRFLEGRGEKPVRDEREDMNSIVAPDTPEFKKWFGDSVVREPMETSRESFVDKKPMVVYHGTNADIRSFETGRPTVNDWGWLGTLPTERHAIFFTDNPKFASTFADARGKNANVVPAYLSIKNPFYMDNQSLSDYYGEMGFKLDEAERTGTGEQISKAKKDFERARGLYNVRDIWELFDGKEGADFVNWLKSEGYDGATFEEEGRGLEPDAPPQKVWAAFDPVQIKSAIGNRGTFNPQSADILESIPSKSAAESGTESPTTVGTQTMARRDTDFFRQARTQLPATASISELAQLAQRLKTAAVATASTSRDHPQTTNPTLTPSNQK